MCTVCGGGPSDDHHHDHGPLGAAHARRVNPGNAVLQLSARSGDGMEAWLDWIGSGG